VSTEPRVDRATHSTSSPSESPQGESSQGAAPPAAAKALGLVLLAIVGAEFLLQLDGTILNVALPRIQEQFGVRITTGSWILNAFYLAFGGLLLLSGRLGDVFGHRKVFVAGISLVTVASLLAGLAPNVELLLVGRALQGVGAALAGPTGLALLTILFDGESRQRAFGFYSTVTGLGAASGMVLSGLLTSAGGWRWSLLINVPIGLAIVLLSLRVLGVRHEPRTERTLGLPSAVLVTTALGSTVYALVNAAEAGWSAPATIGTLAASVVLFVALAVVDRRSAEPLLPGRIFAHRIRLGGCVNLLLLAATLGSYMFFAAQYLAVGQRFTPLQTGLALLPFAASLLVSAQFLNKALASVDLKLRGIAGLVVLTAGMFWLSLIDAGTGYLTGVLPPLVVVGIGVGVAIVPFNVLVLSSADPEDTGITAGIVQSAITVGGLIGIGLLLLPYTATVAAEGDPVAPFATIFTWCTGAGVLGVLVALLVWYGPGARPTRSGSPAATG
jgi:EmrB/QacA subfamily drug resistance transporter